MLEAGFDRPFSDTAIVLLAAGKSSRFDAGGKLMAMYRGAPIIVRSSRLLKDEAVAIRIAVVGERQRARTETLRLYRPSARFHFPCDLKFVGWSRSESPKRFSSRSRITVATALTGASPKSLKSTSDR